MNEKIINLNQRDYSLHGLMGNPFPYSGVPDEEPQIYVGQKNVIRTITRVLSPTVANGKSNHLIITGSYGNGKSHTLKFIKSEIVQQFSAEDGAKICVGYISQPGESFLDLYRRFMDDLGHEYMRKRSEEYLGLIAHQMSKEGLIDIEVPLGSGWDMITSGEVLIAEVVPRAISRLNQAIKYIDFARGFVNIAYHENSIYSWEWLNGEGIDYMRRREIGVSKNLDEKSAMRAFIAFKQLLNELDYSTILMLVDEFEFIEALPTLKKQKMLNNIRHLIDMNPKGLSIVIACAPEVWQTLVAEYHAFSERIIKETNLKPLTREDVRILITSYLNTQRAKCMESPHPFTEESIDRIFQIGQGNTRRIISLCSQVLDTSVDLNIDTVDQEIVNSIIA